MPISNSPIAAFPIAGADTPAVLATITGTFAASEAADTAAFTTVIHGVLAATEATDDITFITTIDLPVGYWASVEGEDAAAFGAGVLVEGPLAVTEDADTIDLRIGLVAGGDSVLKTQAALRRKERAEYSAKYKAKLDVIAAKKQAREARIAAMVRQLEALAQRYAREGVDFSSLGFETHAMQQEAEDDAVSALLLTE